MDSCLLRAVGTGVWVGFFFWLSWNPFSSYQFYETDLWIKCSKPTWIPSWAVQGVPANPNQPKFQQCHGGRVGTDTQGILLEPPGNFGGCPGLIWSKWSWQPLLHHPPGFPRSFYGIPWWLPVPVGWLCPCSAQAPWPVPGGAIVFIVFSSNSFTYFFLIYTNMAAWNSLSCALTLISLALRSFEDDWAQ